MICDRCGKQTAGWKTSWFNLQTICLDCASEEESHPRIEEAKRADHEAVKNGNYNFEGIGWDR